MKTIFYKAHHPFEETKFFGEIDIPHILPIGIIVDLKTRSKKNICGSVKKVSYYTDENGDHCCEVHIDPACN